MAEPRREGAGPAEMAAAGAVAFKPARRGGAANGMAARHGASRRGGDGRRGGAMEARLPYDDFPVVFLPPYESPPAWVPPHERLYHPDYNNELTQFLPRTVVLKKPPGAQLGFNIRGGKASQLGIFISKVCPPFPAPCQVPWVLQGRLGVCGHRHTPCARPRAQGCNLELAR